MPVWVDPKYAMEFRAVFRNADADFGEAEFHVTDGAVATVRKDECGLHISVSTSGNLPLSDISIPAEDVKALASAMRDYEENEDYEYAKIVASYFAFGRWSFNKPMSAYSD